MVLELLLISGALAVLSTLIIILRNMKHATIIFVCQQLVFAILLFLSASWETALSRAIAGCLIIPYLLRWGIRKTNEEEIKPTVGGTPLIILLIFLTFIIYAVARVSFDPLSFSIITLTSFGLMGLLVRRDILKMIICLNIAEGGVHLLVASATPVIALDVSLDVAMILSTLLGIYLATVLYTEYKTLDAWKMKVLKW